MASWQVNQARNHWSDVLDQAESEGLQIITHHGKERAVVLSIAEYHAIKPQKSEEKLDFISYLSSIPKVEHDEDAEIERDDPMSEREIDL